MHGAMAGVGLLFAVTAVVAEEQCDVVFAMNGKFHKVPVKGGQVEELVDTQGKFLSQNGLVVDGVREIMLWSIGDKIYKSSLKGKKGATVVVEARLRKGIHMLPRDITGLAVQTQTHTAYASVYDDRGPTNSGYRVFAFDYLQDQPEVSWEWCGAPTCSAKAMLPTGGSVVASDGKVFLLAASGARTRGYTAGGAQVRHWVTGGDGTMFENKAVKSKTNSNSQSGLAGEMGTLVIDEATKKMYFNEAKPQKYSNLWTTNYEGESVERLIEGLPSFDTWNRRKTSYGVPQPNIASLGGDRIAVATRGKIFVSHPSTQQDTSNTIYTAEDSKVVIGPIASFCYGRHVGGLPESSVGNDEL